MQGTGTGFVDYQITNEIPVTNRQCTVEVQEDDSAGMLNINVSFQDTVHGAVQVGISVFDYSAMVTRYDTVGSVNIGMNCETPLGGWATGFGSTVNLMVSRSGTTTITYSGSFNAQNLTWQGPGNQDALAIKFGSYNFKITPE